MKTAPAPRVGRRGEKGIRTCFTERRMCRFYCGRECPAAQEREAYSLRSRTCPAARAHGPGRSRYASTGTGRPDPWPRRAKHRSNATAIVLQPSNVPNCSVWWWGPAAGVWSRYAPGRNATRSSVRECSWSTASGTSTRVRSWCGKFPQTQLVLLLNASSWHP